MAGFSGGKLILDSEVFVTSSGENNNVPINSSLMYVAVSNELDSITGLDPGDLGNGYLVLLVNVGPTNNLLIKHNDSSSDVDKVILTADGGNMIIPPYNTVICGYDTTNQMWHVVRVPDTTTQSYQATPADPTGTTNATGVMMGLAGTFTPNKGGKLQIIVSGNIANSTLGDGAKVQIRYGTGTAPTNGAALTGTATGGIATIVNPLLALLVPGSGNFTCNSIVNGLTLGTAYWIDVSLGRITGGTATITGVSLTVTEI